MKQRQFGGNLIQEIRNGSKGAMMKKRIITNLMYSQSTTITDLAKTMDLSIPTITKLIDDLCDLGYVQECGKLETTGGRHPTLYSLNASSGCFIGVELGRHYINIGAMDFKGEIIKLKTGQEFNLVNTMDCYERLCERINAFISDLNIQREKIIGINIAICGRVNPDTGYSHSFLNFDNRPLGDMLTETLGIDVSIENDSRAMLYAEYIKGDLRKARSIILVNISWGLGIAIMIDGKLYRGKSGFSGELGHNYGYDNQILCYCGKKGCIETENSCAALHRMFIARLRAGETSVALEDKTIEEITLDDIFEAVRREDLLAIDLVENIGKGLGVHVGGLINLFNPDMVIIGGEMSQTGDFLLQPLITSMRKHTLTLLCRDTELRLTKLKSRAGVTGACLLARSKLFE